MDPRLHISNQTSPPAFIMLQMSHRISTLCQQNSALTRQHAVPDMAILWRTFYVYMGQSITLLNHYITNRSPIALTLFRVIDFICAGVCYIHLPPFSLGHLDALMLTIPVARHSRIALAISHSWLFDSCTAPRWRPGRFEFIRPA